MANALDSATTLRVLRLARLPVRVRVIPMPGTDSAGRRSDEWRLAERDSDWRAASGLLLPSGARLGATKWILDGTGIERLSLLRAPYADRPAFAGQLDFPPDTVRAMLREALAADEQPVLHAIGDSTIALVLATMTKRHQSPQQ
jgi:predicted amidohydrolase YtcJ